MIIPCIVCFLAGIVAASVVLVGSRRTEAGHAAILLAKAEVEARRKK